MKKLCFVCFVYGEKYQEFIPIYILSALTSYPEYDVRIYIDNGLTEKTKKSLAALSKFENRYTIIEHYADSSRFSEKAVEIAQIQRCQRWLFFDPAFLEYEAVYIGDVDLLIFNDEKPIFEQHMQHCELLEAPYSNIRRTAGKKSLKLKMIGRNFYKFGPREALKYYLSADRPVIKFSGLHFVQSKPYYDKLRTVIDDFYDELNLLAEKKSSKYNLCSFNNEALLRDIVLAAGFNDCEDSTGKQYNIETDARTAAYRPHHGIHLGVFRSPLLIQAEKAVISSPVYISYYRQLQELQKTDEYRLCCAEPSKYLSDILSEIDRYYGELI